MRKPYMRAQVQEDKIAQKRSHQLILESLGMIVSMHSATSSKLAVVAGIVVMAIADGLSDSISLRTAEEAEVEKGGGKLSDSLIAPQQ
ncbi:MAG: hypothetical protein AOA66_1520 [Candidatus Bathyarchaeota archaeon BA2]|nr:MAG: hypothetical protein AOA66_1520 [Candidatus Bathyarchaeota archaeon BA2]